ncbi:MAG TPA: site-2 protease family protein [Dehalococcoidia bacterium]|nr:site-2 protease family protein [Dehalococcoidia bacterium]
MGSALNIGKLFGIQLRLHYTWFIIFVFLTVLLVSPHWLSPLWWITGIITCLLFFASVIAHELAHSLVGRANGIPIKSITLFIFGGVAQMTREATRPIAEFKMAAAGPICSLVIGCLFGLLWLFTPITIEPIAIMVQWLAFINVALAIFNFIPGFPLDGGRVFRSLLWHFTGNYQRSTLIATQVGRVVGYLFILGGILIAFLRPFGMSWFNGLWLVFIGWFLENAASASYRQSQFRETLHRFTASQVMTSDYPVVPSDITISRLVQEYVLVSGRHFLLVADEGQLKGIVTLHNIKTIPQGNWGVTQVKEIMIPINKLKVAYPDQDALSILEQMDDDDMNQMPVVSEGRVIGLIARDNLIRFLRIRSESGI